MQWITGNSLFVQMAYSMLEYYDISLCICNFASWLRHINNFIYFLIDVDSDWWHNWYTLVQFYQALWFNRNERMFSKYSHILREQLLQSLKQEEKCQTREYYIDVVWHAAIWT